MIDEYGKREENMDILNITQLGRDSSWVSGNNIKYDTIIWED